MKYLKELAGLMTNGECLQYSEEGKAKFKRIGIKAMKELAVALELKEYDVSFNPGGSNNWLKFELLARPDELKDTIMRLKN